MGDGRQALDVRTKHSLEGSGLGLAEFGEFGGNVADRAVVLAKLDADTALLGGGRVPVLGQCTREGLSSIGDRRLPVHGRGQFVGQFLGALPRELGDRVVAARLPQVPQGGGRKISSPVERVRERGASLVGQRVDASRAAPAPGISRRERPRLPLDQEAVGDQGVQMPANRGSRQIELLGDGRCALRTLLEHQARDTVTRPIDAPSGASDFHNISMTYFAGHGTVG